ncbi:MAG: TIGR02996 domain-containing protein [Deltaproteobacteria bacterium]|nr:TIGR02996 domain-containing protein [Deltaproteobacteria bacterium]
MLTQAGIGVGKLSRGSKNLEALLEAIHDNPDDDAPRLVYADALLERGDPRGEFISLQLRPELDRDAKKREKELLTVYGKQWLGDLAPVVMAGYEFARGFLSECKVDNRHVDRLRKLAGHPAWATVRTISGSALIALHPVMKGLRRLSFTSYEARNHEELPSSWNDLLVGTERPIEALRYAGVQTDEHWEDALENNDSVRPGVQGRWIYVPQAQEVAALCSCSALPKLRELVVVASPDLIVAPLSGSQLIHRLDTIGFVFDYRGTWTVDRGPALALFASMLRDAPTNHLRFELGPDYHTTFLELTRGGDVGYRTATLTVGPTTNSPWSEILINEAIGVLDSLPATVRELRITTRRDTDLQQVARLRAAAEQMKLDLCDVGY